MKDKFKKLEKEILDSYPYPLFLTNNTFSVRMVVTSEASLEEFIKDFLVSYNNILITAIELQKDKYSIHTKEGKRRSLGDIYLICRSYFPDVPLRDVLKCLCSITNTQGFRSSYCYQINKRVWYYSKYAINNVYNKGKTDEWGHRYNYYASEFLKNNE